ncbi:MAG: addiction module protein [Verrucomicrobiales bacterium]|nr:addiction module protein [Verrucomicrobiales bacterium]
MILEKLPQLANLSASEKWLLASELWDEVSNDPEAVPVSEDQKEIIRERWENYRQQPEDGRTWEDIKRSLGLE